MDKQTKLCPICGEEVAFIAKKCKHCREMIARECPFCCEVIAIDAKKCDHCSEVLAEVPVVPLAASKPSLVAPPQLPPPPPTSSAIVPKPEVVESASVVSAIEGKQRGTALANAVEQLKNREHVNFAYDNRTLIKWFAMTNAAALASMMGFFLLVNENKMRTLKDGATWEIVVIFLIIGSVMPFIMLAMSKFLAKKAHNIRTITDITARNDNERILLALIDNLATRAGLPKPPELGIYESKDMNAFATGMSKSDSLVAFSSALLNGLDGEGVAAVAAHEIAHIANGDMITMTLVQSAINAIVLLFSIPLKFCKFYATKILPNADDWITPLLISIAQFVFVTCLLFLGNLVVKTFSRHREFAADRYAAQLTTPTSMSNALRVIGRQPAIDIPAEQKAYAAFKISSPAAILDIFSTHPSIERRIEALAQFK